MIEAGRDGWLARFVAGGLSKEEVEAIAETGPAEDTPEARRKGEAPGASVKYDID